MRIYEFKNLRVTLSCWVPTGTRFGKNTFPLTWGHSRGRWTLSRSWCDSEQTGSATAVGKRNIFCAPQKAEEGVEGWAAPAVAKPGTLPGKRLTLIWKLVSSWVLGGAVWGLLCKNWDSVWQLLPENTEGLGGWGGVCFSCVIYVLQRLQITKIINSDFMEGAPTCKLTW